jgi:hypothetical protein
MANAAKEYGITVTDEMHTKETLVKALESDSVVICSVGPGVFTDIGHYIVIVGVEEGKLIVHDPFNTENTEKRWDYEEFGDQIKAMWTYKYSKPAE